MLSTNPKRKQCIDTMNLWGKLFSYELLKEDSPTASIFKVFMLVDAVFKGLLEVKSISFGGVEDYIERVYRRYTTLIQQWAALIEELDCSKWQTLLSQCEGFSSQVDNIFTVFAELPRNGASRNLIVNYEESIQKFNSAMSLILKHYNHKILSTPNNSFNKGNLIYVFKNHKYLFHEREHSKTGRFFV
ncbi:MAG: hypothetical protein HWD59_13895 [Coxiellaceae bacterium]|nr:MAG: hypothetical protein HWD59_13895 [Coxiellaceae bacterium]